MTSLQVRHRGVVGASLTRALAVGAPTTHHFVVTATDRLLAGAGAPLGLGASGGPSTARVRLEHLPGDVLSSMLRVVISMTDAARSYTIHQTGHTAALAGEPLKNDGANCVAAGTRPLTNAAVLHVVGRIDGDFGVNNAVYHALQQACSVRSRTLLDPERIAACRAEGLAHDRSEEAPCSSEDRLAQGPVARCTAFSEALAALQADAVDDDDLKALPAHPLHHTPDEAAATAANMAPLSPVGSLPAVGERAFYFFPHRCDYRTQIAYETDHFVVLVNNKPVVPGHLMVVPRRVVPTVHGLGWPEVAEWGLVVRHCFCVLRRLHPAADGYCLAIQQGKASGQTVPHLHTHIMPFDDGGQLAGEPEEGDEARQRAIPPRSAEAMRAEAEMLRAVFREAEADVC